jgi:gliding motility-associated-like protein
LYGNTPDINNKGVWTQTEGPNTAIFVSYINPTTVVTNLIQGTYRFVWKIYNERCFTTDTVTFIINEPAVVNAGNDIMVCNNNETILLSAASVNSIDGKGTWSIISGRGTLSSTAPTFTPNAVFYMPESDYYGAIVLRLSAQDACHVVTDDVTILLNEISVPISATDDNATTEINTTTIINVLANDIIYYNDTLDFCSQNAVIASPLHGIAAVNADGSILYTPQNGYAGVDSFQYQICTQHTSDSSWNSHCYKEGADSAWVYVTINRTDCIVPNAFSPNGDGVNDAFVIECGKDWKLTVFNSWGIELFRDEDYHNDWQGTYNGAPIPDGTYFYSLKYTTETNETVEKAGFICLHR